MFSWLSSNPAAIASSCSDKFTWLLLSNRFSKKASSTLFSLISGQYPSSPSVLVLTSSNTDPDSSQYSLSVKLPADSKLKSNVALMSANSVEAISTSMAPPLRPRSSSIFAKSPPSRLNVWVRLNSLLGIKAYWSTSLSTPLISSIPLLCSILIGTEAAINILLMFLTSASGFMTES